MPARKKEIREEMERLQRVHDSRRLKIQLASAAALAVSSWLTAKGLYDKTIEAGVANAEGMITAGMSAAVAGTLMSTATMLLIAKAVESYKDQRRHILLLSISILPFVLGISSYNAILGNAGPASLVYEMRDRAQEYRDYYHGNESDAARAQSSLATLQPLQESLCTLAKGEAEDGVLTGIRGKGLTYAAYQSACINLGSINKTLSQTVMRKESRDSEADGLLTALQAIPNTREISVFERQAAFREVARKLVGMTAASGGEHVSKRLGPQVDILEASVSAPDAKSHGVNGRQASAINNLKGTLGIVRDTVRALVSESAETGTPKPEPLSDMGAAVWVYRNRNVPQVLLAILLDMMPGWFMGLLLVSKSTLEKRRRELEED